MADLASMHEVFGRFLLTACLCALPILSAMCGVMWLHEHNVYVLERLTRAVRSVRGIAFLLFCVAMILYGGTKPQTNNLQNAIRPVVQQIQTIDAGNLRVVETLSTDPLRLGLVLDGSSTNEPVYALTQNQIDAGFALVRVRTNETWDFIAPSSATVCEKWRKRGANLDRFSIASPTNSPWVMPFGTNTVDGMSVHSTGVLLPKAVQEAVVARERRDAALPDGTNVAATAGVLAPFRADLGIVPEMNWDLVSRRGAETQSVQSVCWWKATESNSVVVTWQNVLLDRDTNTPVCVQAELFGNGNFIYRYDLSGAGLWSGEPVTNILVGAFNNGHGESLDITTVTNLTSIYWHRLDPSDTPTGDRDGDGLSTAEEIFLHHTDPGEADTDYDGLTDYDELFVSNTDPLDPHSVSDVYSDGFALKIGDLDPFSYPEGSTNTVLEHIFYSGTTNGAFAYPQSSDGMAVLRVSVSGSGTGDLVIGGQTVPLIGESGQNGGGNAPRLMRSSPSSSHPPLLVQLVKGETYKVYFRGDELLEIALDSDDFAFGVLPTRNSFGYINFPNTVAETPCIHDFNARKKIVSLPMGSGAEELTATWSSSANGVTVSNLPPRSVAITGNFSARQTRSIFYTLSHPSYLFGQTQYAQSVRFCPQPPEPEPDEEEVDEPWYSDGEGDPSDDSEDHEEHWCCYWGTCDEWCGCGCACGGDGGEDSIDDEDFDEECPEHSMPYDECAHLHEDDYTNAVNNVQHLGGVLYIREPPLYEQIHLEVPTEHRNCCPCPDHWTNYVGVAYKSYRLKLIDANGANFTRTESSCEVNLAGVYPSSSVGDATLAFSRNGEVYRQYDKTVLGVAIKGDYGTDLAAYNALDSQLGFPMTVCTNDWQMPEMRLVTNVKLPSGNVHLELADATGQFTVWYFDRRTWEYKRLLDSTSTPVKGLSLAYWKAMMKRATGGGTSEMPICISSSTPGTVALKFRYWTVIDGKFVEDEAVQRITSVRPPLRFDITRDGSIDDGDSESWLGYRRFHYWINDETIKGDHKDADSNDSPNKNDLSVNGTFDLINFFPVALDLAKFTEAWGNRVTYEIHPQWGNTNSFNYCFADILWREAGKIQTNNVTTTAGQTLSAAGLNAIPGDGILLPYSTLTGFSENSGIMVCEAKSRGASMRIDIRHGDTVLYSYEAPMEILPVKEMYSWCNFRTLSNDVCARNTSYHKIYEENNTKSLIFLHGANVSEADAEKWGDILFKRMWVSGVKADFYNVDWRSNIGAAYNYHANASNAFVVASQIVSVISNIPNEKVIMAHSLGNMVVSSMIQDYGLQVSKYIMCNSAVPAEAYDPGASLRVPQLVHPDWDGYPTNSWASSWHKLFVSETNDDRKYLGWPSRFANVSGVAINFYSTGQNGGDEVLEMYSRNDIGRTTGMMDSLGHYSWHKQEMFKGRGGIGGTDWSGWNIEENWLGVNKISVSEALQMSDDDFRTNTVFYCYPPSMNSTNITLLVRGAHLAKGIPALTPATGVTDLADVLGKTYSINLNVMSGEVNYPNNWPNRSDYPNRWLHSDMKDVAFFFNFPFFKKVIEKGNLK